MTKWVKVWYHPERREKWYTRKEKKGNTRELERNSRKHSGEVADIVAQWDQQIVWGHNWSMGGRRCLGLVWLRYQTSLNTTKLSSGWLVYNPRQQIVDICRDSRGKVWKERGGWLTVLSICSLPHKWKKP